MSHQQPFYFHYPGSPPPLTRNRRASLTFTASALERFQLPNVATAAALPTATTTTTVSIATTTTSRHTTHTTAVAAAVAARPPRRCSPRKRTAKRSLSPRPTKKSNTASNTTNEDEDDQQCSICMSNFTNRAGLSNCSHSFCLDCIQEWSKCENSCPLCKQRFTHITTANNATSVPVSHRNQQSDTLEALLAHLGPTVRWALQHRVRGVQYRAWLASAQQGRSPATAIEIDEDEDEDVPLLG